ncbi:MAG TPA: ABC transporter permease [Stellaceae bacterium]|nr:ABC transporter permease [Stellaceae bacterium]
MSIDASAGTTPRPRRTGRRIGSPWTGVGVVVAKETADILGGARMVVIEALMFLIALVVAWFSATAIRQTIGESPFLYLRLLTVTPESVPLSVISIIGLVTPVIAIALGFDAINGEFNQRTLSRLLAQPIYRDALLFGKFLARLLSLAIALVSLWLLVLGLGMLRFGLPPNLAEVVRMVGFLVATIAYGGVWLAIAVLFSVLFRAPATAALAALGLWLLFTFFWALMVTPLLSTMIGGPEQGLFGPNPAYLEAQQWLDRVSPATLYSETAQALLQPEKRFFGMVYLTQLIGALPSPLPTAQSFLLVWPQFTGLVAATIIIFAIAYVAFQRREIRA